MAYQANNKGGYNKGGYNKGGYNKPAGDKPADNRPNKPASDEKPVGGLQQVIAGGEGEKDTYVDVGGLWKKQRKSDGKVFFTCTGKKDGPFAGMKFIISFNE